MPQLHALQFSSTAHFYSRFLEKNWQKFLIYLPFVYFDMYFQVESSVRFKMQKFKRATSMLL